MVQRFLYYHDLWPGVWYWGAGLRYEPESVSSFAVTIPLCEHGQPAISGLCGHIVENGGVYGYCPCTGISQIRKSKALVLVELGGEFWAE